MNHPETHPPPFSVHEKTIFHKTCNWCPKGWGLLLQRIRWVADWELESPVLRHICNTEIKLRVPALIKARFSKRKSGHKYMKKLYICSMELRFINSRPWLSFSISSNQLSILKIYFEIWINLNQFCVLSFPYRFKHISFLPYRLCLVAAGNRISSWTVCVIMQH